MKYDERVAKHTGSLYVAVFVALIQEQQKKQGLLYTPLSSEQIVKATGMQYRDVEATRYLLGNWHWSEWRFENSDGVLSPHYCIYREGFEKWLNEKESKG